MSAAIEENPIAVRPIPIGATGRRHASGWWGMLCLILTEGSLFAYLLFSYYYTLLNNGSDWLASRHPSLALAAPDTAILLLSSLVLWWAERGIRRGRRGVAIAGAFVTFVLGAVFVAIQIVEWSQKPFSINSSSYGSFYFTITGFHLIHVVVGLFILLAMFVWSAAGYFDRGRHAAFSIGTIYWHFVDAVWLIVFFTFYVIPYLV